MPSRRCPRTLEDRFYAHACADEDYRVERSPCRSSCTDTCELEEGDVGLMSNSRMRVKLTFFVCVNTANMSFEMLTPLEALIATGHFALVAADVVLGVLNSN